MVDNLHLRILHLDDSDTDLRLTAAFLRRASRIWSSSGVPITTDIHVERTLQGAVHSLQIESFDVVVVELDLPDAKGLEALHTLRTTAQATPIIVVAGTLCPAEILASIDLGVADCIPKAGLDPERLLTALVRAVPARTPVATVQPVAWAAPR